jgi:hypothetical protein
MRKFAFITESIPIYDALLWTLLYESLHQKGSTE